MKPTNYRTTKQYATGNELGVPHSRGPPEIIATESNRLSITVLGT